MYYFQPSSVAYAAGYVIFLIVRCVSEQFLDLGQNQPLGEYHPARGTGGRCQGCQCAQSCKNTALWLSLAVSWKKGCKRSELLRKPVFFAIWFPWPAWYCAPTHFCSPFSVFLSHIPCSSNCLELSFFFSVFPCSSAWASLSLPSPAPLHQFFPLVF